MKQKPQKNGRHTKNPGWGPGIWTIPFTRGWSRKPASNNYVLADAKREVIRDLAASLHTSPFYSIMADETTDSYNREQVVMCFRWVDNSLNAHEEFIGGQQVTE